jgi:hypothetical protein
MFLAVAAGAGFAAGRLFRVAKADTESSSTATSGNGYASGSGVTAVGAVGSSQGAADGTTTALPSSGPEPVLDEQAEAAEPSGLRTQPRDSSAESAAPAPGATPAPTPYGGASGDATPGGVP